VAPEPTSNLYGQEDRPEGYCTMFLPNQLPVMMVYKSKDIFG